MSQTHSSPLMILIGSNLSTIFKHSGFRSEYSSTSYMPRKRLQIFLADVLPVWTNIEIVKYETEEDAKELLGMLQSANVIHEIIQAYGMDVKAVYSEDDFTNSPAVVELLKTLWHTELVESNLGPLKQVKTVTDLILTRCPSFYQMYNSKKSEYDHLVYRLDTKNMESYFEPDDSDTCTCGHGNTS